MPKKLVVGLALGALFFSLAGGAFAVSRYVITSVNQVKPSVRRALRGARGARGNTGRQGIQGVQGPKGPQGPPGPVFLGLLVQATGPTNTIPVGGVESSIAVCPNGYEVVSGGGQAISPAGNGILASAAGQGGWFVFGADTSSSGTGTVTAYAYCAPTGQAVTPAIRAHDRRAANAMLHRLRGEMARAGHR